MKLIATTDIGCLILNTKKDVQVHYNCMAKLHGNQAYCLLKGSLCCPPQLTGG
jgi:hypothetical protein